MLFFLFLLSSTTFAASPWSSVPYEQLDPNNSYLINTRVNSDDFNIKAFGGPKRISELRQQYEDQTRDYYALQPYQTDDISTAIIHYNQLKTANQSTYNSAYDIIRKSESTPYIDNVRAADKRGDISKPVQYTAVTAGTLMGNEVQTNAGSVKIATSTNLYNQNSYVKADAAYLGMKENVSVVVSPGSQVCSTKVESDYGILSAIVTPNASTDPTTAQQTGLETYQVSYVKPMPYTTNFGTSYLGSTQIYKAFISKQIWKQWIGQIDNSWGNPQIGMPPEIVCRITYNMHF